MIDIEYNQITNMCLFTNITLVYYTAKIAQLDYKFSQEFEKDKKPSFKKSLKKILHQDFVIN